MSYEFTKLSNVPAVSEFPEGANAIIETNGEIKRCPPSGGGGGSADFVINGTINSNMEVTLDKTFAQIQAAIQEGKHTAVHITGMGDTFLPLVSYDQDVVSFGAVADVSEVTITSVGIYITADTIILTRSFSPTLNSDGALLQYPMEADPISPMQIATKKYVDDKECILKSTTPGSTKKFKITVDDAGTLSATEVTE